MIQELRASLASGVLLVTGLCLLSSCNGMSTSAQAAGEPPSGSTTYTLRIVRSGTEIKVALGGNVSSEIARVGDAWHGTVTENVRVQNEDVIPPGSEVTGMVTGVIAARPDSRALLELAVRSIRVNGHVESIPAIAEPVIAGSPHARRLGALSGGVAIGALIGRTAEDGELATVARDAAGSEGCQVVLPDGTVMSFTVSRTVAVR